MKNITDWHESKFVYKKGQLRASRDVRHVAVGSRLVADIVAGYYHDYLSEYACGKLIDLGCGKVPLYEAYSKYIESVTCVDWVNTPNSNKHLDYECDISGKLPFNEGEFDTAILSDVLEHIPQPEVLWAEVARILKPNGHLILNVPFYYKLHEQPYDFYRYTEYALRRFAEMSGFKIIELTTIGGSPEIISDILAKHMQHIPILGKGLASFVQSMTYLFINTRFGRRISKKTSAGFPFGYFMVAKKV